MDGNSYVVFVALIFLCARDTNGQSAPRVSPASVNATNLQTNVTLNCDVQNNILSPISEDDVLWYKLSSDTLSQFPPDGTSCGQVLDSGSGSGIRSGYGIRSGSGTELLPRNEFNITGDIVANGSFSLTIAPIQFGDEGYYVCVIRSAESEQECFSNYATVVVAPTGSVSVTPDNEVFEQGMNVTFTCNNKGGPNNTIIWEIDGDRLPLNSSHQISVFVNASTGGNHTCIVTNAAGSEAYTTTLYVFPLFTENPEPFVDATNGTNAAFACDADSFPEPMYQWIRLDDLMVRENILDANRPNVLGFMPTLFGDEGTYVCRAFIRVNGTIHDVNSTAGVLTLSPEVEASPDVVDGVQGGNASFNCTSMGGPGNQFAWMRQRDGVAIGNMFRLTLDGLDAFDGGQYQCLVENRAGNDTSTVTLNIGPAFVENPQSQRPTLSESFSLSCNADGFPSPNSIIWFHNGTVVDGNSSAVSIMTQTLDNYTLSSTLEITSAGTEDSGNYYCVASSPRQVYGNVTSETARVSVLNTPERPQNITALDIQSRYLLLTWVEPHDNNAPIQGYLVFYNQPDFAGGMAEVLNVTEVEANVTGLYPGATYNFTVVAFNEVGNSSLSAATQFRTMEEVPSNSPQNVNVFVNSSTEIQVRWEEVPAIDQNGIVIEYEVLFEPLETFGGQLMSKTLNSTELFICLVELQEFVNYNISVRAYTSVGPGFYSERIFAMTLEDNPTSSPVNITAEALSSTVIRVLWGEVPAIDQNGIIRGYSVEYEPLEEGSGSTTINVINSETTLSGLQEYMLYNISVRAFTNVGPGPYSSPVTVITDEDSPSSAPLNVMATAISSVEISVSWEEVPQADQNGIIIAYEVLSEPQVTFDGALMEEVINVTNMSVLLDDLHPFVNYSISVRAYTIVGDGPYATVVALTMEDSPASSPTNITTVILSSTSIMVSWEEIPPFDLNGIFRAYEVLYEPLDTFDGQLMELTMNATETSITLTELEEFLEYNITVRVYTSAGPGPDSDAVTEMTPEDVPSSPPVNVESAVLSSLVISVSWEEVPPIDQNGIITDYEVLLEPLETFDGVLSPITSNTTNFDINIMDLMPFVSYNISVRAYTSEGPGPYSEPMSNTTSEEAPDEAPGIVSVDVINSTSLNVSWEEIPPMDRNGIITTYEVRYEPLMTFGGTLMPDLVNTSDLYIVIDNLQEFVAYNISVRAYTSVGPGPFSDEELQMTEEDRPSSPPENVETIVMSSTSIFVQWEEVPPINQNGEIIMYEVQYIPLVTFGGIIGVEMFNTSDLENLEYLLDNLEEYVEYNISVRAYTIEGPGPYSIPVQNQTFQDLPTGSPINVSAEVQSSTFITVTWDKIPAIDENGMIITYEVLYEPLETFEGMIMELRLNTSNLSASLIDLEEFVNYSISVRGYTIEGPGNYSTPIIAMTLEDVPAVAPVNVRSEVLSSTSINVTWEDIPQINMNGIIRNYEVLFEPLETFGGLIGPETANTSDLYYVLVGLQEYVDYNISVRAYTRVGFGQYSEEITNQTFQDLPDRPPSNVSAEVISSTSISVFWGEVPSIDENGIIITYEILLQPETTFGGIVMESQLNSSNFSVTVTDLQEFLNYSISVRAYTVVGAGNYSEVIVRMTLEDVPRVAPLNVMSQVLSSTSISVAWDEITPVDVNGIFTTYEVLFVPLDTFSERIGPEMDNTTNTLYLIDGLEEYVNYNISVRAYTRVGSGPYSVPITNQTFEDTPRSPPGNIMTESVSSTIINVTWEEVPPIDQNGIIVTYEVCYEPLETFDGFLMKEIANTSELFYRISGLQEFVEYNISIRAYTSEGPGPYSDTIVEMTQTDRPRIAPLNITSEAISSTSIYVAWQNIPPIDRNGIITDYEVRYQPIRQDLSNGSNVTVATNLDLTITELEEFAYYDISVRAFTTAGPGVYSVPIMVQTMQDLPGPVNQPPSVLETEINATSAIVRWSPPDDPNGIITNYRVTYNVSSSNPRASQGGVVKRQTDILMECVIGNISNSISPGNVTMALLAGLTPFTVYNFGVVASTNVGEGRELSPLRSFATAEDISTPPRNLVAEYVSMENASSTSLQLSWDHPECDYGVRTGYNIMYVSVQLPQGNETQQSNNLTDVNATSTGIVLSSLKPNTNYSITMCATTIVACGNTTAVVGLTNEDAPYDNITLEINSTKLSSENENRSNSIRVEFWWTTPSDRNGSYYFELTYSATQDFDGGRNITAMNRSQISGDQQTVQFEDGLPYAMYTVKILAYNIKRGRAYSGSPTMKTYRSIAIEPTSVNNLTANAFNSSSIEVKWSRPTYPNGPISSYTVYYRKGDMAQNQPIIDDGFERITANITSNPTALLNGLKPYTYYKIHVRAIISYRSVNLTGDANVEIVMRTNSTTPDNPEEFDESTSVRTSSTILIQIPDPARVKTGFVLAVEVVVVRDPPANDVASNYENVDLGPYMEGAKVYITAAWTEEQVVPSTFTIGSPSDNGGDGNYTNVALKSNTRYGYFIRYTIENDADAQNPHYHYSSFVTTKTDLPFSVPGLVIGLIIIVTVVATVVVVVAIFINRKRKRGTLPITGRDGYLKDPTPSDEKKVKQEIFTPVIINPLASTERDDPIAIEDFADHVRLLHANDDYLFSEEYLAVEPTHSPTTEATRRPENITKNRYANITSYDHSRVRMLEIPGVPGSDYINANYLDGYTREKAFIATQGPVPGSVSDFWRMIWEQGTAIIVMLTNLEEKGRVKCFKYWPDERTLLQGNIRVCHQETIHLAEYTVRTFSLQRDNSKEERIVRQFHFTVWPDHGVPEYPTPLLGFVRKVMNTSPNNAGPMVVHCSAGVGRTGTFITLFCQLQKMKVEKSLHIFGFVSGMRRKRCFMVQTESQYVFIHDALLEAIDCGVTEVPARKLREEYRKLGIVDTERAQSGLEIEFTKLQSSIRVNPMKTYCCVPSNKSKNRYANMEMLPYDKTRVKLRPSPGVSGSDYINASHIDGYHKRRAFIATQAPLPDTTEDFWRMVWEQECASIVMLTKEREGGKIKCHKYWPESGASSYSSLQVILHAVSEFPDYILREFKIVNTRDESSTLVKQFHYTGWPVEGVPDVGSGLIDVIGQVQKWQRSSGDRPIVVHCSGGCGRTGTYIAVSILLERLKTEGVVDVFQTARTLRLQRPSMIQSVGQYEFCYKTVLEFLDSFDTYANFK